MNAYSSLSKMSDDIIMADVEANNDRCQSSIQPAVFQSISRSRKKSQYAGRRLQQAPFWNWVLEVCFIQALHNKSSKPEAEA